MIKIFCKLGCEYILHRKGFISLLSVFTISLFSGFAQAQNTRQSAVVLEAAQLTIHGKTNINSFSCQMEKSQLNDTLANSINSINIERVFEGLEISFKVDDFECNLPLMTNDFRHLLNEEEFPFIKMKIKKVYLNDSDNDLERPPATALVIIQIAGETGIEEITESRIEQTSQEFILSGTHPVRMTDFKITPPTKFFGTVNTKDLLEIFFSIVLELK